MESTELKPIVYVSSEERAENYSWCSPDAKYLNPNIDFCTVDDLTRLREEFALPSSLEEGMVLMAHPYRPKAYIDINQAEEELFAMKMNAVEAIARWLGVKTFEATAEYRSVQKRTFSTTNEGSYKMVEAKLELSREKQEEYAKKYSRCSRYAGKSLPEDVEQARQKMKEYGLETDRLCSFLIEQRSGSQNLIESFEEELMLSNELNQSTEIAFSLSALKGLLKVKSETNWTLSKKMEVAMKVKVTF